MTAHLNRVQRLNQRFVVHLLILLVLSGCATTGANKKTPPWAVPQGGPLARVNHVYDVAIIGAGAAGTMAALRGALNNDSVLLFTGGKSKRRLARGTWVPAIESLPTLVGAKRPIMTMRDDTISRIHDSQFKDNLAVVDEAVVNIKKIQDGLFYIEGEQQQNYQAKTVILATGMMDTQPTIKGDISPILRFANTQQAIYCIRCDGHLAYKKKVVVLGSSEDAAQNAIILHERYHPPMIAIVTNGIKPEWNTKTNELLRQYGISVYMKPIDELIGVKNQGQPKAKLTGILLDDETFISAELIVVALGVRVNNELAKGLGVKLDDVGFVITSKEGLTNVSGVYAVGDLQSGLRKQVYVGWDSAVKAAEHINSILRKQKFKR